MDFSCYVLHVKQGYADREQSVASQFNNLNLPFTWILAYDIPDIDEKTLAKNKYQGIGLRPAEISCSLKHMEAWRKIADDSSAGGIVFEDDVLLDRKRFAPVLAEALKEFEASGKDIGIICLGNGCGLYVPWTRRRRKQCLYEAQHVRAADSYYLTGKTAQSMLAWIDRFGFSLPADHLLNKLAWELEIPILWLEPTIATQGSHTGRFASLIQTQEKGYLPKDLEWFLKKIRRKYIFPLLGIDLRLMGSTLKNDLQISPKTQNDQEQ
jgi:glycosyl transferase family 25